MRWHCTRKFPAGLLLVLTLCWPADFPQAAAEEPRELAPTIEEINAASKLRGLIELYSHDERSLARSLPEDRRIREQRQKQLRQSYLTRLGEIEFDGMSHAGQVDYVLFRNHLEWELHQIELRSTREAELSDVVPFAGIIRDLADAKQDLERLEWSEVASQLVNLEQRVREFQKQLEQSEDPLSQGTAARAADSVDDLRRVLRQWYTFYEGYDPLFTWWMSQPYEAVGEALGAYSEYLRRQVPNNASSSDAALQGTDIVGDPIGREALLEALAHEMIPYAPEQLIAIAESEHAWCEREMKRAAGELGFGDDWHAALEHVKTKHVAPGEQPYLIRDLAHEAVEYLEAHDLVTIPPLCKESWTMAMMSPERQRINPFFTGGRVISVSYPTDGMSHAEKLMSMRGNNIHFSRATVHHELIPGHHLQGFMTDRYQPYRRPFATPFWLEGWALYWEMLLYERGDFARSPEDRIGMLFWRMHRCARIIFSIGFHLGEMTPQECIELLVARVGHERANAVAEVRRSFEADYDPLYQAAYMLGGLQFRALHREIVDGGVMTDRQFHDAVLKENSIPVEMVRAILLVQPLSRDFRSSWNFYEDAAVPR